jgi:hypothetical protein
LGAAERSWEQFERDRDHAPVCEVRDACEVIERIDEPDYHLPGPECLGEFVVGKPDNGYRRARGDDLFARRHSRSRFGVCRILEAGTDPGTRLHENDPTGLGESFDRRRIERNPAFARCGLRQHPDGQCGILAARLCWRV